MSVEFFNAEQKENQMRLTQQLVRNSGPTMMAAVKKNRIVSKEARPTVQFTG